VARQSQLLRGVFPVLFHPLPPPVWADDVDNRVNFGMDIGQCVCVASLIVSACSCLCCLTHSSPFLSFRLLRDGKRILQVGRHGDRGDGLDPGLRSHQHYEGCHCRVTTPPCSNLNLTRGRINVKTWEPTLYVMITTVILTNAFWHNHCYLNSD